jgi:uncharacterized surface protein with fasciclin (FAS1) repeats
MKKTMIFCGFFLLLLNFACTDPFAGQLFFETDGDDTKITNAAYLDKNTDVFSEWIKVLKYADLYNALNDSKTTTTMFAPNNDAVKAFLAFKGVATIEGLDRTYVRKVVLNHLMTGSITDNQFLQFVDAGGMEAANMFNARLTLGYGFKNNDVDDADLIHVAKQDSDVVYINNQASVLGQSTLGHVTSNGVVYTLGGVVRPIVETITDKMSDYKVYTIMLEALQKTGWADSLKHVTDTLRNTDGSRTVMTYTFTVFATPDTIYKDKGILSFSDLATNLGSVSTNYTDTSNVVNKYVAYHILKGTYKKSTLASVVTAGDVNLFETAKTYDVVSVQTVGSSVLLNENVGFIRADIPASNGVFHKISDVMPIYKPTPKVIVWDFCNSSDIVSIANNYGKTANIANLFFNNLTSTDYTVDISDKGAYGKASGFTYVSTQSSSTVPYAFYKCKYLSASQPTVNNYGANQNNLLKVNVGQNGWLRIQTPPIIAGKYKVEVFYAASAPGLRSILYKNGSLVKYSLDDYISKVYMWKGWTTTTLLSNSQVFDEVVFGSTAKHSLKILIMDPNAATYASTYYIFLDYIKFTPIN